MRGLSNDSPAWTGTPGGTQSTARTCVGGSSASAVGAQRSKMTASRCSASTAGFGAMLRRYCSGVMTMPSTAPALEPTARTRNEDGLVSSVTRSSRSRFGAPQDFGGRVVVGERVNEAQPCLQEPADSQLLAKHLDRLPAAGTSTVATSNTVPSS